MVCSFLVLWTILDRKALKENAFFIIVELCVNIILVFDISFKIKLAGCRRYFTGCSNLFDFSVAMGCVLLYITIIIMSACNSSYLFFEEVGEELMFIIWSVWQYLRILMLIKNQNKAKEDALDIIEFSQVEDIEGNLGIRPELHLDEKPRK